MTTEQVALSGEICDFRWTKYLARLRWRHDPCKDADTRWRYREIRK